MTLAGYNLWRGGFVSQLGYAFRLLFQALSGALMRLPSPYAFCSGVADASPAPKQPNGHRFMNGEEAGAYQKEGRLPFCGGPTLRLEVRGISSRTLGTHELGNAPFKAFEGSINSAALHISGVSGTPVCMDALEHHLRPFP